MSERRKIVMTKTVRERLQRDIAYGNDVQACWNRYRRDFLILLAVLFLIMFVLVIANILLRIQKKRISNVRLFIQ